MLPDAQVLAGYRVTSFQTLSSGLLPLALGSEFNLERLQGLPTAFSGSLILCLVWAG